jgi:Holliday junction resolvase-like predicted endonuclease
MERRINRGQQGDIGEASAIDWLTRMGAVVLAPIGRSPDFDLVACVNGRLLRIQVKTSTQHLMTPTGETRSAVNLVTSGGNQSWNGTAKKIDPARFDYLFVLTSDGRRWFIPSTKVEARSAIRLGGPKYSEFEIDRVDQIADLVYVSDGSIESPAVAGEYPSGQRTATVNRQAQPSQVRILPPPFRSRPGFAPSKYERSRGQRGEAVINQKRRVTIPQTACTEAGLQEDDRMLVRSDGDGRVVLERIEPPPAALASVA